MLSFGSYENELNYKKTSRNVSQVQKTFKSDPMIIALAISAMLSTTIADTKHANAQSKFHCGNSNGFPATMVTTQSGKRVPIINWKSTTFSSAGWTPQRRCQLVSERFNKLDSTGQLNYLTVGYINNIPVICGSSAKGNGCNGLLYTLKPGQNAARTLRNLLAIRYKATGPLTETASRPYISIKSIEDASENAEQEVTASPLSRHNVETESEIRQPINISRPVANDQLREEAIW